MVSMFGQRPVNDGRRFSMKAAMPSFLIVGVEEICEQASLFYKTVAEVCFMGIEYRCFGRSKGDWRHGCEFLGNLQCLGVPVFAWHHTTDQPVLHGLRGAQESTAEDDIHGHRLSNGPRQSLCASCTGDHANVDFRADQFWRFRCTR